MAWVDFQNAVKQTISDCLGLEPVPGQLSGIVEWEGVCEQEWTPSAWAELRLGAVRTLGTDEIRTSYDPINPALPLTGNNVQKTTTYCGVRIFTVSILISSYNQEPGSESVGELTERIRLRIRRPDRQAPLRAANVALVRIHPTLNSDYNDMEGRQVSGAVLDIEFSCAINETEVSTDGGQIDRVTGTVTATPGPETSAVDTALVK